MTMKHSNRADLLPRNSKLTVLRRLSVSDLADFQEYRCDPEVARYQGWQPESDAKAKLFLAHMNTAKLLKPGHWCQIGITHRSTDTLIGDIGICVAADQGEAEIGFSLARHAQNKGIATEAVREAIQFVFEDSEVKQVVGMTDARNVPSIRLLERVSMEKCREFESIFRGEPCTEILFTISRNDMSDRDHKL